MGLQIGHGGSVAATAAAMPGLKAAAPEAVGGPRTRVELAEEARERQQQQRIVEMGAEAKRIIELGVEDLSSRNLLKLFEIADANIELEIRNEFYLDGDQVEASLSATAISLLRKKKSFGFFKLKQTIIPYEDVVAVRTSRSPQLIQKAAAAAAQKQQQSNGGGGGFFRFWRSRRATVGRGEDDGGGGANVNKFGFLDAAASGLGDTLDIYYVPEASYTNRFTLEKVSLRHDDPDIVSHWASLVGGSVPTRGRPRRLLVFINPHGGRGQAPALFYDTILPLFSLAGIETKIVLTERANHARDLLQSLPLSHLDGVISVGGDGMFSEVFNGVLLRTASDAGLDPSSGQIIQPRIRVGFIPGGSTDCIALCLHGTNDPVTAALHIILGDSLKSDAVSVHTAAGLERICMTMVSYGYFGDLLRFSERLRWMGPKRYDVAGIKTFLRSKAYSGTLQFRGECRNLATRTGILCGRHCSDCRSNSPEPADRRHEESRQIKGKFLAINAVTTTCKSPHTKEGMSPEAHYGDGNTDLIIVHRTSRLNYFRYLFRVAFHRDHPLSLPFVEAVRVREFTFTPDDEASGSSIWNCDGEIVNEAAITVKVHRRLVPVFARGVYNENYRPRLQEEGGGGGGGGGGVDSNYNSCYEQIFNEEG